MSIENFAVRWTKQETELLEKYIESEDYEMLCELLPGRSVASIKAKRKRILKTNPIPAKFVTTMLRYYVNGEAEGQILQRMMKDGYNYTLKDIGVAIKKARTELEQAYAKERGHKPTLDQLREFING